MDPPSISLLDKDRKTHVELPKDYGAALRGCFSFDDMNPADASMDTSCKFAHRHPTTNELMFPVTEPSRAKAAMMLKTDDDHASLSYKPASASATEMQLMSWVANNVTKDNLPEILNTITEALDKASLDSEDSEISSSSSSSDDGSSQKNTPDVSKP